MSTLTGRDATALVVIDVQNGVVEGAYKRDEVIANIKQAVAKARAASVPRAGGPATWCTWPTATACSPAASARITAPSGWAAPSSR